MTVITKSDFSFDTVTASRCSVIFGLLAGEDLEAGQGVTLNSDGNVVLWDAVAESATSTCGVVLVGSDSGQPCSIYGNGLRVKYGSGLTPDALLYPGEDGALSDAAIGTDSAIAKIVSATDIVFIR